ncbi:HU family DNA-binding protein [Methylobacterium sp. V23]|uniref:HU family DNA-binding protein n=1 Tax=Methylobacterium sp. V23 TaxID=2044878 RepID=UPI000CDAEC40|nr:HU family DNA-binding protein [Methylobacterium sp. V23]POR40384.1 integration host factor subunit beta [Methylobacterium sp. V23]
MIKSELILRIAEQNSHLYERDVEALVNVILKRITDALIAGERVELRGFGMFLVKPRGARTGRNPKTGAAVPVADKLIPAFKVGKTMQARLDAPEPRPAPNPRSEARWQSRWLGKGPALG